MTDAFRVARVRTPRGCRRKTLKINTGRLGCKPSLLALRAFAIIATAKKSNVVYKHKRGDGVWTKRRKTHPCDGIYRYDDRQRDGYGVLSGHSA